MRQAKGLTYGYWHSLGTGLLAVSVGSLVFAERSLMGLTRRLSTATELLKNLVDPL